MLDGELELRRWHEPVDERLHAGVLDRRRGLSRWKLAVGTPFADRVDQEDDGAAHLVGGGAQRVGGDRGSLGSRGLTIRGARAGDGAGTGLAAADLDGDRRPDLLVGAPFALARPGVVGGAVYLLCGAR